MQEKCVSYKDVQKDLRELCKPVLFFQSKFYQYDNLGNVIGVSKGQTYHKEKSNAN